MKTKQKLIIAGMIGLSGVAKASESNSTILVDRTAIRKIAVARNFSDLEQKLVAVGVLMPLAENIYVLDQKNLELQKQLALGDNDKEALSILIELAAATNVVFKDPSDMQVASQDIKM